MQNIYTANKRFISVVENDARDPFADIIQLQS